MSIMSFILRVTELSLGVLVGLSFTLLDPLYICVSLFCYIMVTTLTRSVSRYKTKNIIQTIVQIATLITLFCLVTYFVFPAIILNNNKHDAQLNSTSSDISGNSTGSMDPLASIDHRGTYRMMCRLWKRNCDQPTEPPPYYPPLIIIINNHDCI